MDRLLPGFACACACVGICILALASCRLSAADAAAPTLSLAICVPMLPERIDPLVAPLPSTVFTLSFVARNISDQEATVGRFLSRDNHLVITAPDGSERVVTHLAMEMRIGIPPGGDKIWQARAQDALGIDPAPGIHAIRWVVRDVPAAVIQVLVPRPPGEPAPAAQTDHVEPGEPIASCAICVPSEPVPFGGVDQLSPTMMFNVSFVVCNGTDQPITVEPPLAPGSRLIAKAPDGTERDITTIGPGIEPASVVVPPGGEKIWNVRASDILGPVVSPGIHEVTWTVGDSAPSVLHVLVPSANPAVPPSQREPPQQPAQEP